MQRKIKFLLIFGFVILFQLFFIDSIFFTKNPTSKKYLRWTKPPKGYRFNNQIYVLLGAMFMAIDSQRTIIPSAGFNLKTDNLPSLNCNISDIYNLPNSPIFETNETLWNYPMSSVLTHPEDLYYSNEFIVDMKFQELYFYVDGRIGTFNYLKSPQLCHVINEFRFAPALQQMYDSLLNKYGEQLKQAIGIHLRAGDYKKEFCEQFWWDLRFFVFACFPSAKEIIHDINRLRSDNEFIFISTNAESENPILKEVLEYYHGYILNISIGYDYYTPILSAHLLAETKIFLGNHYSTFTNVVEMRRCYKHTHYFMKTLILGIPSFYVLPPVAIVILYLVLFLLSRSVFKCCCKSRLNFFSKTSYITIGIGWFLFAVHKYIPAQVYIAIGVFIDKITFGLINL